MARSILWCTHLIGLESIKGEYDHISKCWTLISTGRSRCPSILYWVNTDSNSIILILQWLLLLYSVLQLNSVLWTELLISKGELQSLLPYLSVTETFCCLHSITQFHRLCPRVFWQISCCRPYAQTQLPLVLIDNYWICCFRAYRSGLQASGNLALSPTFYK